MAKNDSTGETMNGSRGAGGIDSHMSAKDGETSHLVRHPTCAFHSSVQMARPLKTCSHIHLPFRSLLITTVKMASLQKMKGVYYLFSSSVIVSATSALASPFRICRTSSWQSMKNFRSWNT